MRKSIVAGLLAAALTVTACGTRLPDEAFEDQGAVVAGSDAAAGDGGITDGAAALDDGTPADGVDGAATDGAAGDGSTGGGTTGGTAGGGTGGGTTGGSTGGAAGPNQASDVGITADQIVIGNITAETGVLGDTFAPAARGMRAWTAAVNAKGGINGRQVVLKTCDDGEVRNRTLECAKRLVERDKVFAIVGANTRSMGGAAQYLNDKGVPVLGMPINNSYYRYPHFWSVYPFGYPRDGKTVGYKGKLMYDTGGYRWFKQVKKLSKAAVFTYDVPESKQAGEAFAQGLRLEGFAVRVFTVSFAAPSFDQAVATMESQGTQLIVDSMDDGANRKLCDSMQRAQFKPAAKLSTVVVMGDKVGSSYNDTCRNIIHVQGSTREYTATVPAIAEFRAAFARYQPGKPLHQWALEAWAQGQLVAEAIAKMGAAPTRKGLEDHLRGLDDYRGGGIFTGLDWRLVDYSKSRSRDCFAIARWQDGKKWVDATGAFPYCVADAYSYSATALEQGN